MQSPLRAWSGRQPPRACQSAVYQQSKSKWVAHSFAKLDLPTKSSALSTRHPHRLQDGIQGGAIVGALRRRADDAPKTSTRTPMSVRMASGGRRRHFASTPPAPTARRSLGRTHLRSSPPTSISVRNPVFSNTMRSPLQAGSGGTRRARSKVLCTGSRNRSGSHTPSPIYTF